LRINSRAARRADRSPLSLIDTLFVDKGGVLIDNEQDLGPQWRRLIGEFLSHRLGGSAHSWGEANVPAFARQVARWRAEMATGGPADIRSFFAKDASQ